MYHALNIVLDDYERYPEHLDYSMAKIKHLLSKNREVNKMKVKIRKQFKTALGNSNQRPGDKSQTESGTGLAG